MSRVPGLRYHREDGYIFVWTNPIYVVFVFDDTDEADAYQDNEDAISGLTYVARIVWPTPSHVLRKMAWDELQSEFKDLADSWVSPDDEDEDEDEEDDDKPLLGRASWAAGFARGLRRGLLPDHLTDLTVSQVISIALDVYDHFGGFDWESTPSETIATHVRLAMERLGMPAPAVRFEDAQPFVIRDEAPPSKPARKPSPVPEM